MFKFSSVLKIFVIIFPCWLVGSFLFGKFEAYEDGYNEIGFPFVFYRTFSGKCFDCKQTGFMLGHFILDALIVLLLAFLLKKIIQKTRVTN